MWKPSSQINTHPFLVGYPDNLSNDAMNSHKRICLICTPFLVFCQFNLQMQPLFDTKNTERFPLYKTYT